jgi:pullulanase
VPITEEQANEYRITNAYLESDKTIVIKLSHPITRPYGPDDFQIHDQTTGTMIPVTDIISDIVTPTNLVQINLARTPDVTHTVQVAFNNYSPHTITPRNVLNSARYTYTGNDLGNTFTPEATAFRLWAPTASTVRLLLYNSETGPLTRQLAMQQSEQGTWYIQVEENLENWYYLYQVTVQGSTRTAIDPYVTAIAVNAQRGMIIDLQKTNPPDWEHDYQRELHNPVDAIIYEVHVRDFSIAPNSGMHHKGQYLAFTERGTTGPDNVSTGIEHLQELGITHVHILPIAEFASIDENKPDQYNWGYDPRNYNVPEGAYASIPHGTARITECKRMIQSLHQAKLGVIMDVVYNHTFATGDSDFDRIVPQYYYRTDYDGSYTDGSGVGNELATERPMVQKFVRDSLSFWASEYHLDGFRFDLMALLGVETMSLVSQDLHTLNPSILLYGEPWTGNNTSLSDDQLLFKGRQKGLNVSVFNDNIRNNLIGSVFDRHAQGFATGAWGLVDAIKQGVTGSIHDFTAAPGESINYVTSHDNMTLWDKITASTPAASNEQRIKMDMLAQAVILTAQGVAFLAGGEEFLRSKGGNDNSYNAGDVVNQLDWTRKAQYSNVCKYYAGLIRLRMRHPAFRMTTADAINQHLAFLDSVDNTLAFIIRGHANGDEWNNIIVIYNPDQHDIVFNLPKGNWTIAVEQDQVDEQGLRQASGNVTLGEISCMVLFQGDV